MMRQRVWSIRQRMLAIALGVALLAWLVGGIVTVLVAERAEARMRDARLAQLAETVLGFSEHELGEIAVDAQESAFGIGSHVEARGVLDLRYRYQIWTQAGTLLTRSAYAPRDRPLAGSHVPGYATLQQGDAVLRSFVLRAPGSRIEIQVAESQEDRSEALAMFGGGMVATMLLSMLAVALLAGWLVVRALGPVQAVERQLAARQPFDLQAVDVDDAPSEIRPMLTALNQLLARIADKLSHERGFTARASHELRTPLAALRLQAQVALRESDPLRRERQLRALVASVDRCDHLVEQLLTLARVEQDQSSSPAVELDWPELCEQVIEDLAAEIARRQVRVDLDLSPAPARGRPLAVQMLLRNLVSNALAHVPQGGRLRIATSFEAGAAVLRVEDSGPGIDPVDRERVFDRFVRLERPGAHAGSAVAGRAQGAGRQDGRIGVGLGLSIVRSVADEHGASIVLGDSTLGGLSASVSFPGALAPADSPDRAP